MSVLKVWLRRFLLWGIPLLVLALMLLSGFIYWVVASQPGSRWAVQTAMPYVQGSAQGVQGTIWSGLRIERLILNVPDTHIEVSGARLFVEWRELLDRRLHVREISAQQLDIALSTPSEPKPVSDTEFSMPTLPVSIAVDKVAVGQLFVQQDGQPLPVDISRFMAAVSLGELGGQLRLYSLDAAYENIQTSLEGELDLASLHAPYPLSTQLRLQAHATDLDAPLCAQHYLPEFTEPETQARSDSQVLQTSDTSSPSLLCALQATLNVSGSLEAAQVDLTGKGQGLDLQAHAYVTPFAQAPVEQAKVVLSLPDDSSFMADLNWQAETKDGVLYDALQAEFESHNLDIYKLAGKAAGLPQALLKGSGKLQARLINRVQVQQADLNMAVESGSRWNQQALEGQLNLHAHSQAEPGQPDWWRSLQLADSLIDLRLGKNQIKLAGSLGLADSRLSVLAQVPESKALWPGLELGKLNAKAEIKGTIAQHSLELQADYDLGGEPKKEQLGHGPVQAKLNVQGKWAFASAEKSGGWDGRLNALDVQHAGIGVQLQSAMPILFSLPRLDSTSSTASGKEQDWWVQVGASRLATLINGRPWVQLVHDGSRYQAGQWQTRGGIDQMVLSEARLKTLEQRLGLAQQAAESRSKGGVKLRSDSARAPVEIAMQARWDLAFAGALKGIIDIERVSGDIMVPADPPFALGLEQLALRIQASPTQGGRSRLEAHMDVRTKQMGYVSAKAETLIHATPQGGLSLRDQDPKRIDIDAHIDDLSWTSLFLGDAMELGGKLDANLRIDVGANWKWTSTGKMNGRDLRFTLLDEGVRLLNGTLQASFDNETFRLDKLYFPAALRVEPHEWRTATWVTENPDAKGGGLTVSGQWNLADQRGAFVTDIYRFPILQRADRYAMISGQLQLDMNLPQVVVRGKVTADAGWFNLDMLGGIPSLDSDVIVVRGAYTESEDEQASGLDNLSMEIEVDLGPRFYLTGYGVNSGLVGSLKISMIGGRLTAIGVLRTRGGRVELYGQKLLLRRGMVTFQGDITAPILDIEALRSGLPVQAGVKVVGTARRPRIDLVSYPDVDESEKLSWLILGHGSDDSGGDLALLLSVGTSFLGDGEPFYRRFGIDEVSMSSGDLGSVGSVLPVENVVPSLEDGVNDAERRFVTISKSVSSNITLSLQQALSDTGTVGRASYRLARGLTADLSVGTVNGLALIYRWFSSE